MSAATPSDLELLSRARRGDSSAATELYTRHASAARRLAASYPRAGDPDDLVNEAFERVLGALSRGAGPNEAFRAYLFVTLRRIAAEQAARSRDEPIAEVLAPVEAWTAAQGPAFDEADRQIVLTAYQSLPDRQQEVLWHTAVEGRPPRDLASVLGVSANAVAALASRARERLREAYLQAHLQVPPPAECAPHRSRLGAYVRDGLSARDKAATDAHVSDCHSCRVLVVELADVNQLLVRALHPLFLSTAASGAVAATGGGAIAGSGAGRAGAAGRRAMSKAKASPVTVGVVVVVAALVAALVGVRISDEDGPELASPAGGGPGGAPSEAGPSDRPETSPTTGRRRPADSSPTPDAPPDAARLPDSAEPQPTTTIAAARTPVRPRAPGQQSATAPPEAPPTTVGPAPSAPPPTAPPPTGPPPPTEPDVGPVVWLPDQDLLQITLANAGDAQTDYLALAVTLAGGAVTNGWPTGCDLAVPLVSSAKCAVSPLAPGDEAVVRVPIAVTGPGQQARVSLCAVDLLTVDCNTDILHTTTTDLTP
jgi:RNA polymerase sigma factor (sigma-70 family)